jgi:hypothetical protein
VLQYHDIAEAHAVVNEDDLAVAGAFTGAPSGAFMSMSSWCKDLILY